ncbi:MAG: hypothetical protein M3R65_09080 [Gemmatimonadota bacterium]|nr:hypothetical protein [Gemmatimonadota bacterium]
MAVALAACSDSNPTNAVAPPQGPTAEVVAPDPTLATALTVSYQDPSADSVRAEYQSADGTDAGDTPWYPSSTGDLPVLGLRASTPYLITLQSRRGHSITNGNTVTQNTGPLPVGLQGVSMSRVSGASPSGGYTLTALIAGDGNGYAVAFDSSGTLRWYRGIGRHDVMETKQQPNGDITIYVGSSRGFDPLPGGYLEVTPTGDSVRMGTGYRQPIHRPARADSPSGRSR